MLDIDASEVPGNPALSPRARSTDSVENADIWLLECARCSVGFTFGSRSVWSPDGARIVYAGITAVGQGSTCIIKNRLQVPEELPLLGDVAEHDSGGLVALMGVLFLTSPRMLDAEIRALARETGKPSPSDADQLTMRCPASSRRTVIASRSQSNQSGRNEIYVQPIFRAAAKLISCQPAEGCSRGGGPAAAVLPSPMVD